MKKGLMLLGIFAAMLVFIPVTSFGHTCDDPYSTDLVAGGGNEASANVVGAVEVCNDGEVLYVTYVIEDADTCLLETHLQVATSLDGIPQTKKDNPIPGQFEFAEKHNCVTEYTYELNLDEWTVGTELFIAAHSVVQMSSSVTSDTCASVVEASTQGFLKNGSPVSLDRSNPESALGERDYSQGSTVSFFSLGFEGEIILSFDSLVGGMMSVYEATNGTGYPLETAEVYVSRDGENWTFLGVADNLPQLDLGYVESNFTLGKCISYVKIIDTTNATPHANDADAFDLDAVCTSYSCNEETAWGDGTDFPGKNWATYFNYTVCPPVVYGIDRGALIPADRGNIYLVDMVTGASEEVGQVDSSILSSAADLNSPNGFAFDQGNQRIYYSLIPTSGPSRLYFYDLISDTNTLAGTITSNAPGASFYNDKYYYIPSDSDDLYVVTFNGDGTIATNTLVKADISDVLNRNFNFGDIAIQSDGVLYGSGGINNSSGNYHFFTLTLNEAGDAISTPYSELGNYSISRPQIAFGGDGVLYGAATSDGQYYTVSTTTGVLTTTVAGFQFNDLAAGQCISVSE